MDEESSLETGVNLAAKLDAILANSKLDTGQ